MSGRRSTQLHEITTRVQTKSNSVFSLIVITFELQTKIIILYCRAYVSYYNGPFINNGDCNCTSDISSCAEVGFHGIMPLPTSSHSSTVTINHHHLQIHRRYTDSTPTATPAGPEKLTTDAIRAWGVVPPST